MANKPKTPVELTIVNPDGLYDPAPNGYSHAIVARGGSRIAYIAGQGGEFQDGSLPPTMGEQIKQAFVNLKIALDSVGAEPNQVARIGTYLVDYNQSMLEPLTAECLEFFGSALPAQTLVPVPRLALDGMLFEIEAEAILE